MVLRVLPAMAPGAAVGVEREIDAQPAGFRTHVLLCLGAALFGLISVHAFSPFTAVRADTNVQIDITRVVSQVVVGVGFLGDGAILKENGSVRGLTTAATMWATAATGLAVGLGYYWPAVAVTLATLVSLVGFRRLRTLIRRRLGRHTQTVRFRLRPGADPGETMKTLYALPDVTVRSLQVAREDDRWEITAGLKTGIRVDLSSKLIGLAARPEVDGFTLDDG
jgi:putative Mg2+ transporter-C (MgtC) family protein